MALSGDGFPSQAEQGEDTRRILDEGPTPVEPAGPIMDLGLSTSAGWSRDGYGTRASRRAKRTRIGLFLVTILFFAFVCAIAWLVSQRSGVTAPGADDASAVAATEQAADSAPDEPVGSTADAAESESESESEDLTATSLPSPAGPDSSETSSADPVSAADESELEASGGDQSDQTGSGGDAESTATTKPVATARPERTTTTTGSASESSAETTSVPTEPEPSSADTAAPDPSETENTSAPETQAKPTVDENAPIPIGVDVLFADGSPGPRVQVLLAPGKPGPADNRERTGFSEDGRLELDVLHGCYLIKLGSESAGSYFASQQRRCFKDVGQRHLVTMTISDRATRDSKPSGCSMRQNTNRTWRLTIWDDEGEFARRYQARNESDDVWALQSLTPISMSDTTVVYEIPGTWYSTSPEEWLKVTGNSGKRNSEPVFCSLEQ